MTAEMKDHYPVRAANLASRVLNGEAIIMNPVDSKLFSLNETATVIWLAADGTRTLREIVEHDVCGSFEIDPETALAEADPKDRSLLDLAGPSLDSRRAVYILTLGTLPALRHQVGRTGHPLRPLLQPCQLLPQLCAAVRRHIHTYTHVPAFSRA